METDDKDLLSDVAFNLNLEDATLGQRFLNYIIDLLFFYLVLIAVFGLVVAISGSEQLLDEFDATPLIIERLIVIALYGFFMGLVEGWGKGRTLGKLVSGTKTVKDNGELFTFQDAMRRGLARMVPLEPLSTFGGRPWHDKWTDTRVVKIVK